MPGGYTYFRKYFILNDDYSNINNIHPKGHGKVELRDTKGVMRINLEDCEKEEEYRIYLLKEQYGTIEELELGRIITDERGRARKDININLRELESKGFAVGETDAILIKKGEYILLSGYIDKDSRILDRYEPPVLQPSQIEEPEKEINLVQDEESQKVEDKPQEIQPEDAEKPQEAQFEESEEQQEIQHESEEDNTTYNEVQHDQSQQSESEDLSKYFPAGLADESPDVEDEHDKVTEGAIEEYPKEESYVEETSQEEYPTEEPQTDEPIQETIYDKSQEQYYHESSQPSYQTYEYTEYIRRLNHKNQMTNYILSVLKFFPQVQPLKMYLHGYTWWRIDDNGTDSYRGFLPYYNYLLSADHKYPFMQNSTTCISLIRKYGHYLFGLYKEGNETKYYVYAVPGRFAIEEHPFKGITGFNTWYDSIDGVGYWILYIDPLTGKVIYPINPMVPID